MDSGIVGLDFQVVLVDVPVERSLGLDPMVVCDIPVRIYIGVAAGNFDIFRNDEVSGLGVEALGAERVVGNLAVGLAQVIFTLDKEPPPLEGPVETARIEIYFLIRGELSACGHECAADPEPAGAGFRKAQLVVLQGGCCRALESIAVKVGADGEERLFGVIDVGFDVFHLPERIGGNPDGKGVIIAGAESVLPDAAEDAGVVGNEPAGDLAVEFQTGVIARLERIGGYGTVDKFKGARRNQFLAGEGHLVLTEPELRLVDDAVVHESLFQKPAVTCRTVGDIGEIHLELVGQVLGESIAVEVELDPFQLELARVLRLAGAVIVVDGVQIGKGITELQLGTDGEFEFLVRRDQGEPFAQFVADRQALGDFLVILFGDHPFFLEDILKSFGKCPLADKSGCQNYC